MLFQFKNSLMVLPWSINPSYPLAKRGSRDGRPEHLCRDCSWLAHCLMEISCCCAGRCALSLWLGTMGTGHNAISFGARLGHQLSDRRNSWPGFNCALCEEGVFPLNRISGRWLAYPHFVLLCLCLIAMGSAFGYQPRLMGSSVAVFGDLYRHEPTADH